MPGGTAALEDRLRDGDRRIQHQAFSGAKGVKLNRTLIWAKRSGEQTGASYRLVDRVAAAKRGLTYRLQLIDLKGKRTWYAAFAIASK